MSDNLESHLKSIYKIYNKYFSFVMPYDLDMFLRRIRHRKQIKKYSEYFLLTQDADEKIQLYAKQASKHPFAVVIDGFKYEEYAKKKTPVFKDNSVNMWFVLHNEKRLYFKKCMTKNEVRRAYNGLAAEQDTRSPHRYLNHPDFARGG